MAYAEIPDVRARLGRLRDAFSTTSQPDEADIERFIDDRSNLLDAILSQWTTTPMDPAGTAGLSLRPMVATGAALDAIDAAWPGGSGAPEVAGALRARLEKTWDAMWAEMQAGTAPAVLLAQGNATPHASALWTEEVGLDLYWPWPTDPVDQNWELSPHFTRTSRF